MVNQDLKKWEKEILFLDSEAYYHELKKDIRASQHYITLEMYIFHYDTVGKSITEELILAKKRGVEIEIVVDGIGSYHFYQYFYPIFKKHDIKVKIFNPLPLYHPFLNAMPVINKSFVIFKRLWKINHRDHRKIITIDKKILYTGSFNLISAQNTTSKKIKWVDIGVKVIGDNVEYAVLNFKKIFKKKEYFRYKKKLPKNIYKKWIYQPLRLNQTLPMRLFYQKDFIQRIMTSKKRIWIMTPYFIPRRKIIKEIAKASSHGVDVKILISKVTDVHFFKWLQYFYFEFLLKRDVKIYLQTDKTLHAKNFIIDDFMTVGSTNLNHRSFIHDLEVDLVVEEEKNKRILEEHFLRYTNEKQRITMKDLESRSMIDRFICRFLFLFRYWF